MKFLSRFCTATAHHSGSAIPIRIDIRIVFFADHLPCNSSRSEFWCSSFYRILQNPGRNKSTDWINWCEKEIIVVDGKHGWKSWTQGITRQFESLTKRLSSRAIYNPKIVQFTRRLGANPSKRRSCFLGAFVLCCYENNNPALEIMLGNLVHVIEFLQRSQSVNWCRMATHRKQNDEQTNRDDLTHIVNERNLKGGRARGLATVSPGIKTLWDAIYSKIQRMRPCHNSFYRQIILDYCNMIRHKGRSESQ